MRTSPVATEQPRDPGLQAERTALSWSRTGVAVLTNSLLALRSGWVSDEAPITALALALLVAAGAIFAYGAWRRRDLLKGQGAMAPPAGAIVAAAVITLVACATGLASVLVRQGLSAGSENP